MSTKSQVVDLTNIPALNTQAVKEAKVEVPKADANFLPDGEGHEFLRFDQYPPTTMKEQALGNIRVNRLSESQRRQNEENADKIQFLANLSFALVLANGQFVTVTGARIAVSDPEKGPFVSMPGFSGSNSFIPYIRLRPEQNAFLTRYALREMEKWTEEPELVQSEELI